MERRKDVISIRLVQEGGDFAVSCGEEKFHAVVTRDVIRFIGIWCNRVVI